MAYTAPANMATGTSHTADRDAGAYRAYQILHVWFTALPIIAGIDKFTEYLTNWEQYLAPEIPKAIGLAPHTFMMAVGVVEIVAGLLVAFIPRIGSYVVAAWLLGIVGNLMLNPVHYWDVAARDFGLCLAAIALGSLSAWTARNRTAAP